MNRHSCDHGRRENDAANHSATLPPTWPMATLPAARVKCVMKIIRRNSWYNPETVVLILFFVINKSHQKFIQSINLFIIT